MRRMKKKTENDLGMSIPGGVLIAAAISVLLASSAAIIAIEDRAPEDRKRIIEETFHLNATPDHRNGTAGEEITYNISLCPHIYLYAPCYLRVPDQYDGMVSAIEPDVIYPGDIATLTLYSMQDGDFHRDVIGVYHGSMDTVRVTVTLSDEEPTSDSGEFDLVADPVSQTTNVNMPVVYQITVDPGEDFTGCVDLEVMDMFDGVLSVLRPESIEAGDTAYLTLTPLIEGEFSREIVGINDEFEVTIEVFLTVHPPNCYEP